MPKFSTPPSPDALRRIALPSAWCRTDVLLATLALNALSLGMPLVVLQVYDRILPNDAIDSLVILAMVLVAIVILEAALRLSRQVILIWQGAKYEHTQSVELFDRMLCAKLIEFDKHPAGTYLDSLQNLERVREFYSGQSILMLVDLPFVLCFLTVIFCFAGNMVLIPLGFIALFVVLSYILGRALRNALVTQNTMDGRRQNFLIEALNGIHTIKALAMEKPMMRRYERLQGQSAESVYELSRVNSVMQGLGATFSQIVMVTFVSVGSVFVVSGELTIGALAAGTMLSGRVLQPALKAMGLWTHMQTIDLSRLKIDDVYQLQSETKVTLNRQSVLKGAVTLENVSYRFPGAEADLLKDVSLAVKPGEWVGISGANGSGKTTLLNLIIGFSNPASGRVLLDGVDIEKLDQSSVRAQIGLMPSNGVLFDGTILENLTLFRDGPIIDDAIKLTRAIGLDEEIRKLPQGLETRIGGSLADGLSQGVRNRIIIVRAIVGAPPILLFDDANAAFDFQSDKRLLEFIRELKGKRTMFLVSHRPSLLRLCDRQFELVEGRLQPMVNDAPANAMPARLAS